MLTLEQQDNLLCIRAGGELSSTDYDKFESDFDRVVPQDAENVPMLIELEEDFSGWNLGALWRDIKFDVRYRKTFGRIAVIGERRWEKWGTKLTDPLFPSADMRFYEPSDRAKAVRWARGSDA